MDTVIVGAGIAGVTSAYFLAKEGVNVKLVDQAGGPANGASGNPFGLVYPYLSAHETSLSRLQEQAFAFFERFCQETPAYGACHKRPVLHFLTINRLKSAFNDILERGHGSAVALNKDQVQEKFPRFPAQAALWIENGFVVEPKVLCQILLENVARQVDCYWNSPVLRWHREGSKIKVYTTDQAWLVDRLILASGPAVNDLLPKQDFLALNGNLGQLVHGPHPFKGSAEADYNVCHKGYLTAQIHGQCVLGASYQREPFQVQASPGMEKALTDQANPYLGTVTLAPEAVVRASVRATTPDRCPYLGEISPGIWVHSGHGSRGLVTAPYLSWCLTNHWTRDTPIPDSTRLSRRSKRKKG